MTVIYDDDDDWQGDNTWDSMAETAAAAAVIFKSLLVRWPRLVLSDGTQFPLGPAAGAQCVAAGARAPGRRAAVAKATAWWARVSYGGAAVE